MYYRATTRVYKNHLYQIFVFPKGTSLKRFTTFTTGRDTPKPVGYQLRATSQDMVHFQSIPLTHFRNVELLAAMGTSSVTNILGQKLFCCLPLVCCRVNAILSIHSLKGVVKEWVRSFSSPGSTPVCGVFFFQDKRVQIITHVRPGKKTPPHTGVDPGKLNERIIQC